MGENLAGFLIDNLFPNRFNRNNLIIQLIFSQSLFTELIRVEELVENERLNDTEHIAYRPVEACARGNRERNPQREKRHNVHHYIHTAHLFSGVGVALLHVLNRDKGLCECENERQNRNENHREAHMLHRNLSERNSEEVEVFAKLVYLHAEVVVNNSLAEEFLVVAVALKRVKLTLERSGRHERNGIYTGCLVVAVVVCEGVEQSDCAVAEAVLLAVSLLVLNRLKCVDFLLLRIGQLVDIGVCEH